MIASIAIVGHEQAVESEVVSGKLKFLLVLVGLLIFGLVAIQLVLANFLATQGEKIATLEKGISDVDLENKILRSQIATQGSISRILDKAKAQGMEKPQKFFFVSDSFALSQNNKQ